MNRILTCGLAAVVATLAQPVYADHGGHSGGGGARGGGGGVAHAAPAVHAAPAMHSAPMHANVMRAPSVPHMSAPIARTSPRANFTPSVTQNRSFQSRTFAQPQQRNVPSVAFGGHAINNNNNAAVNAQNFAATNNAAARNDPRGNFRSPPMASSRGWDHGRVHEWNHHHYRWYGGAWVLWDGGYPYDNDYGYPYGAYYGDEPAPDVQTYSNDYSAASSQSLAMGVQDQLTRLGYSPGPVDGVIGAQTRDAIANFQYNNHMPPTGQIDGPLLQALGLQ